MADDDKIPKTPEEVAAEIAHIMAPVLTEMNTPGLRVHPLDPAGADPLRRDPVVMFLLHHLNEALLHHGRSGALVVATVTPDPTIPLND
jgi:hypothetical protein